MFNIVCGSTLNNAQLSAFRVLSIRYYSFSYTGCDTNNYFIG